MYRASIAVPHAALGCISTGSMVTIVISTYEPVHKAGHQNHYCTVIVSLPVPTSSMWHEDLGNKYYMDPLLQCLQPVSSSFSTKRANFQYFPVIFSIFTHFCEF